MMLNLPSAPTPTPPGRSKTKRLKPWATLWSRSCEHKRAKNTGQEVPTSCPVLSKPFRTFLRVGHGVGQAVDPHFDPHRFGRKSKKNPRNRMISGIFWSCWADSNRRPHPYQGCALPTELQQHKWRPGTGSNRRPLA